MRWLATFADALTCYMGAIIIQEPNTAVMTEFGWMTMSTPKDGMTMFRIRHARTTR